MNVRNYFILWLTILTIQTVVLCCFGITYGAYPAFSLFICFAVTDWLLFWVAENYKLVNYG